MTNDEKAALKGIGVMLLFKAALYGAIAYAAKVARDMENQYDREGLMRPILVDEETTVVCSHTAPEVWN